ncbi:dolichyl-phosphate beta-glucosyltransferase-like [Lineus longissimus]|uniref:dolichyl-phosphate beta-glucosyltransferase-like n=1 Tax=Lineus longissimus TaxID=88925 RepID=UPI002B4C2789
MDFLTLFQFLVAIVVILIILALIIIYVTSEAYPDLSRHESEKYFQDPKAKKQSKFASLFDDASVQLSVIVPSYNEEMRLPVMMDETLAYLEGRQKSESSFTYEIIVVDDGSKDNTSRVALGYSEKYGSDKVRVLTFVKNRGKGGAVRLGMLSARGDQLLFADADGASKFSDMVKLEKDLEKINTQKHGMAVVCGSRSHLEQESIAERSLFRTFMMHGFHFLVWFLCVKGIRDTQCGFKMFTREAARLLFTNLHVNRWAFDVDLLYVAQTFNIPISEVAIAWQEIDGSKMVPVLSWIEMGIDLFLIRLRYLLGVWKITEKPKRD